MPTSAIGSDRALEPRAHRPLRAAPGFTLLELMLVVLVVGLTTALIVVRWPQAPLRELSQEAERLAAQLDILRQQAAMQGQPLIWTANASGYSWSPTNHATPWLSAHTQSQTAQLVLPGEPVSGPLVVELRSSADPTLRATIEASGLLPFKVSLTTKALP